MKNRIFILLAAFGLSATACNDWLDVKPGTQKPATTMFDTYQGYQDAVSGCYLKMKSQSLWGLHMTVTSVEYLAQHWESHATNETMESTKMHDYEDENVKSAFRNIYSGLYNIIVQTNTIIEALPETGDTAITDDDARGVVEGETRAIRAMCHFEILRLFGQVPGGSTQVKLPYTEGVSHTPTGYSDYDTYTGKIERDLFVADSLLAIHDPFVTRIVDYVNSTSVADRFLRYRQLRLNYWAVKALRARYYLYTGQASKAYAEAKAVIDVSDKDGVISKRFGLAGTEDIPHPDYSATRYNNITDKYYALPYEGLFVLSNNKLDNYIRTYFPANNQVNLYMSTAKVESDEMFGERAGAANNRLTGIWKPVSYSNTEGYNIRKYDQHDGSDMNSMNLMLYKQIVPMLRLSELYLIVMETTDDMSEIAELYNEYRKARNIPEDQMLTFADRSEVLQFVEAEYRREFFGEGQMFFYYKRHNASTMLWTDRTIAEKDYIVPLPETEYDPNF